MDRPVKIMHDAQGGRLAGPAWTAFMTEVYRRKPPPPDWPRPDGLIAREIDRTTGMLRNPYCPTAVVSTEWYIPGTEPVEQCTVHSATDTSVGDTLHMEMPVTAGPPAPIAVAPSNGTAGANAMPTSGAATPATPTPGTPTSRPNAAPPSPSNTPAVGVRVPTSSPRPAGRQ